MTSQRASQVGGGCCHAKQADQSSIGSNFAHDVQAQVQVHQHQPGPLLDCGEEGHGGGQHPRVLGVDAGRLPDLEHDLEHVCQLQRDILERVVLRNVPGQPDQDMDLHLRELEVGHGGEVLPGVAQDHRGGLGSLQLQLRLQASHRHYSGIILSLLTYFIIMRTEVKAMLTISIWDMASFIITGICILSMISLTRVSNPSSSDRIVKQFTFASDGAEQDYHPDQEWFTVDTLAEFEQQLDGGGQGQVSSTVMVLDKQLPGDGWQTSQIFLSGCFHRFVIQASGFL